MNFLYSTRQKEVFNEFYQLGEALNQVSNLTNGLAAPEAWKILFSSSFFEILLQSKNLERSAIEVATALEALGQSCKDNGLLVAFNAHLWGGVLPLHEFGSELQKQKHMDNFFTGQQIAALAVTEFESSSFAMDCATNAARDRADFVLNGRKNLISNFSVAQIFFIFSKITDEVSPTCFIIDQGRPGLAIGQNLSKSGLTSLSLGNIDLFNCRASPDDILGSAGLGPTIFLHSMMWERTMIVAHSVGTMARILKNVSRYTKSRRSGTGFLVCHANIQERLAAMKCFYETSRLLLYKSAWAISSGKRAIAESSLCKLHISESYVRFCEHALEIYGGNGYLSDFEIEQEFRDALASRVYSGTSAIQRKIITDMLCDDM